MKIAAFLAATGRRGPADVTRCQCELNGQPAIVTLRGGRVMAAITVSVADGLIHRMDPARLKYICGLS